MWLLIGNVGTLCVLIPINLSVNQSFNEISHSANQPIIQLINQYYSRDRMFIHSIKPIIQLLIIIQSINQSINQSTINQLINQSVIEINRSINGSFNHPIQWRISSAAPSPPPPPPFGPMFFFFFTLEDVLAGGRYPYPIYTIHERRKRNCVGVPPPPPLLRPFQAWRGIWFPALPVHKSWIRHCNQSINHPFGESLYQPATHKLICSQITKSSNQSINQSCNESLYRTFIQSSNQLWRHLSLSLKIMSTTWCR